MAETTSGGNITIGGLRNYTAYCDNVVMELQRFQNVPPFRVKELDTPGDSFRINLLFLRKLVDDLREQYLGATTLEEKAKELSFNDLREAILSWLIGQVFANDWGTFCENNRQPDSQSAASHIQKMRAAMRYFADDLKTNTGRRALFSSFSSSLQMASIDSNQVVLDAIPPPDELYDIMVKIEKKQHAVQRIRQENGLDKYSPARVMPVFSEPSWSSPTPGSWPAVGAHNFAAASPTPRFDPRGLVNFSPPPRSPSSASTASTAPSRGDPEFREARSPFVGLASYDNRSVPERFDHFLQQPVWPSVQLGVDDEIYQSLGSQNELDIACHSALPDLINGDNIPAFVGVLTRELNNGKLEPKTCDDARWESFRKLAAQFVDEVCLMCPMLETHFRRVGAQRDKAFVMTRNNRCWRCGQLGHVRADCTVPRNKLPQGREVYATDKYRPHS